MINGATIAYRLAGREEEQFSIETHHKTEEEAFDFAVEELKIELLEKASHYRPGSARRASIRAIVQLRPWAVRYSFGPGSPGRTRSSV